MARMRLRRFLRLRSAANSFFDYWSGKDAWSALRPSVQAMLTR